MTSPIVRALPKAAQHRIIAGRYKADARAKGRRPVPTANRRVWELEKIFRHRFGKLLPDNPGGREALQVMAEAFSVTKRSALEKLVGYINARAPWALPDAEELAAAADLVARWLSADEMAWRIGLSVAEHDTLGIRTIGIVGLNKRQRKALQKERKKASDTERRRKRGAKPRAEYEGSSISCAKPWEALGISRRTWYRRQRKEDGTSPRPVLSLYLNRQALVPKSARCLRGALRAGPTGLGPYGPRWPAQVEGSASYFDEGKAIPAEART